MKIKKFEEGMVLKITNQSHPFRNQLLIVDKRAIQSDGMELRVPFGMVTPEDVLAIDFEMIDTYFKLTRSVELGARALINSVNENGRLVEHEVLGVVAGLMGISGGAKYFIDELAIILGWDDVDEEIRKMGEAIAGDHVCEECRERFCRGKKEM